MERALDDSEGVEEGSMDSEEVGAVVGLNEGMAVSDGDMSGEYSRESYNIERRGVNERRRDREREDGRKRNGDGGDGVGCGAILRKNCRGRGSAGVRWHDLWRMMRMNELEPKAQIHSFLS